MPLLFPPSNPLIPHPSPGALSGYLSTTAVADIVAALIPAFTSIFQSGSRYPPPSFINGVNVISDETHPNYDPEVPGRVNPLIKLTYTTDGVEKTVSVPLPGHSVPYEFQPSQDDIKIKHAISNITPPKHYKDFFTPERIKIVQDGLVEIVKHNVNNPREGLLSIIQKIMDTTNLTNDTDQYERIYKNIVDNFAEFRFESLLNDYSKEENSAAKTAHIIKKLFDSSVESKGEPNLEEQFNTLLTTICDLIPEEFLTSKNGGQRPKQSYNYAHFIPLKPKSKKSFHDSKSRKVKSRRRNQSRNKHTTMRK